MRTWIHDNLCDLTINCDTGQNSQFLRCFHIFVYFKFCNAASQNHWEILVDKLEQLISSEVFLKCICCLFCCYIESLGTFWWTGRSSNSLYMSFCNNCGKAEQPIWQIVCKEKFRLFAEEIIFTIFVCFQIICRGDF